MARLTGPVTGHSFASVLDNAAAPATNTLQYFEFGGNRALVAELDGVSWKAVTRHLPGTDFDDDRWELYNLSVDPSECNDLVDTEPERLAELIDLWWQEAETHGVLPLDELRIELFIPRIADHEVHRPTRRYTYRPPMTPIPTATASSLTDTVVDITARVSSAADDVGEDHRSAVSARYSAPFAFTGTLHDVTVQLPDGRDPSHDDATAKREWSRQ